MTQVRITALVLTPKMNLINVDTREVTDLEFTQLGETELVLIAGWRNRVDTREGTGLVLTSEEILTPGFGAESR